MILQIDPTDATPIYQQICDQVILGMAKGELKENEQLPSVRQLADEIGINAMTISKAYNLLKEQGYLVTDRRRGTSVRYPPHFSPAAAAQQQNQLTLSLSKALLHGVSKEVLLQEVAKLLDQLQEPPQ